MSEDGVEVEKLIHDEENGLPFENESLDLVVSSLRYVIGNLRVVSRNRPPGFRKRKFLLFKSIIFF